MAVLLWLTSVSGWSAGSCISWFLNCLYALKTDTARGRHLCKWSTWCLTAASRLRPNSFLAGVSKSCTTCRSACRNAMHRALEPTIVRWAYCTPNRAILGCTCGSFMNKLASLSALTKWLNSFTLQSRSALSGEDLLGDLAGDSPSRLGSLAGVAVTEGDIFGAALAATAEFGVCFLVCACALAARWASCMARLSAFDSAGFFYKWEWDESKSMYSLFAYLFLVCFCSR